MYATLLLNISKALLCLNARITVSTTNSNNSIVLFIK